MFLRLPRSTTLGFPWPHSQSWGYACSPSYHRRDPQADCRRLDGCPPTNVVPQMGENLAIKRASRSAVSRMAHHRRESVVIGGRRSKTRNQSLQQHTDAAQPGCQILKQAAHFPASADVGSFLWTLFRIADVGSFPVDTHSRIADVGSCRWTPFPASPTWELSMDAPSRIADVGALFLLMCFGTPSRPDPTDRSPNPPTGVILASVVEGSVIIRSR